LAHPPPQAPPPHPQAPPPPPPQAPPPPLPLPPPPLALFLVFSTLRQCRSKSHLPILFMALYGSQAIMTAFCFTRASWGTCLLIWMITHGACF
jgi:hypothetical protein